MPTLEIDGRTIEVEPGTTVIQAAERLGIEIPHYCWHPGLSVAGNCRMCLVEIENAPKLQIACNTVVSDGMVVRTTSDRTRAAQRAVLEFLLINHPIDCPVCDQAGECKLQEYYMDYDRQRSRVALPDKVRKGKAIPIGPHVMLDQERCILCARCTRFLDEVTRTSELAIYERGDHAVVALAPGKTLDNPYSGNVVDICPVGALTSREFRFRARVWYLERTPSVCAGCATGCNIEIYHREGRIYRFQPRANPAVNRYWMCDAGRLSAYALQGDRRATDPLVREAERFAVVSWEAALDRVAEVLGAPDLATADGPPAGAVGVVTSAQAPNEELYLLRRLAASVSGRLVGVSWSPPDAWGDDFLIRADKNPNTRGLRLFGIPSGAEAEAVLEAAAAGEVAVLVLHRAPLLSWWPRHRVEAALERVPVLIVLDRDLGEEASYATVVLPLATFAESEGTFTNEAGRVQRFWRAVAPPGAARAGWWVLAEVLARVSGEPALADVGAVFDAMAGHTAEVRALSWATLGPDGRDLAGPAGRATASGRGEERAAGDAAR